MTDITLRSDVMFAQETHANESELRIAFPQLATLCHITVAEGPNSATGGVASFIKKVWAGDDATVSSRAMVPGRVLRSVVERTGSRCILWNIHNFGLSAVAMELVAGELGADSALAEADPLHVTIIVGGDFNYREDGEEEFDMKSTDNHFGTVTPADRQQHATRWRSLVAPLTDVHAGEPSHWSAQHSKASRID